MGRSKAVKTRDKRLSVRIFQDDYENLRKYCESKDISISEFLLELAVREMVLNP